MKKILIVEDETSIREDVQEILQFSGYEVFTAENGITGLEIAKTKVPDLILCDVMMPALDGFGVLTILRQDALTETIPIIFLTAKTSRQDMRQGMNLGADDYLTKPFTAEELMEAIASRLQQQQRSMHRYIGERQQTKKLKQEITQSQQNLQKSQQLEVVRTELLQKIALELRNPLSNINMAIHLLKQAQTDADRDRYLSILQEECSREIEILKEVELLQSLLTPENSQLLQRFNILGH